MTSSGRYTLTSAALSGAALRPLDAPSAKTHAAAPRRWLETVEGMGGGLFLGALTPSMLADQLDAFGVLGLWSERGYERVTLRVDASSPRAHQLSLFGADRSDEPLMTLRVLLEYLEVELPFAEALRGAWWPVMCVDYLLLQRPGHGFSACRPQLPGQRHPSSAGMARALLPLLLRWVKMIGAIGFTALPEFLHSGLLFASVMRCYDPAVEAFHRRVQAWLGEPPSRDAYRLAVTEASWAFERGQVFDAVSDKAVGWPTELMLRATARPFLELLDGEAFRRQVEAHLATPFELAMRQAPGVR